MPYLLPSHWPWWVVWGGVAMLVAFSVLVLGYWRKAPYLLVGWLFFIGTLIPTIGLVAVGTQAIADRYTYIPSIGLFAALVWAVGDLSRGWRFRTALLAGVAGLVLLACATLSRVQTGYWRNSMSLWSHTLAVTGENPVAHYQLGKELENSGHTSEAIGHYQAVLRVKPRQLDAHLNLGVCFAALGKTNEAMNYLSEALQIDPNYGQAHEDLGILLLGRGEFAEAEKHCREAVRLMPWNVNATIGLARALGAQGKSDEALQYYTEALTLNPQDGGARYYLALEWLNRGEYNLAVASLNELSRLAPDRLEVREELARAKRCLAINETISQYRGALRTDPDQPEVWNNLAWVLATCPEARFRDGREAVRLAERACERTQWQQPLYIGTLAAAFAETGEFEKAILNAQKAAELAASQGQTNLAERNRELQRQYQNRQPYRDEN